MNNLSAVVLTFLILIIIIIVCDDITKSVLLAGITANFFVIFYYIHEMSNNSQKSALKQNNLPATADITQPEVPIIPEVFSEGMDEPSQLIDEQGTKEANEAKVNYDYDPNLTDDVAMYGRNYVDYSRIRTGTNDPYAQLRPIDSHHTNFPDTYDDLTNTIDAKNVSSGRRRARDKRCKTAMVKKNADYYKYHFGDELKDSENRVWWGRDEF